MLRIRRVHVLLLAALAALSACSKRVPEPGAHLRDAAQAAAAGPVDARTLALAGFHAWLIEASADTARARFDSALQQDPADPFAHYGHLILASRAGRRDRVLDAAFLLLERAPRHPLSTLAARVVLEQVGTSAALDAAILTRAASVLGQSPAPAGDTAHLLRSAQALIHGFQGRWDAVAERLGEMGVSTQWTLAGPFSAHRLLTFDETVPPEATGSFAGPFEGPLGPLSPRPLVVPDGRVNLAAEAADGDVYVLGTDFEVQTPGRYIVRSVTHVPHKLYVDGTLLFERRSFARAEPSVAARAVELGAGSHRLVIKLSHDGGADVSVSVMRADGAAAALTFTPASGPAPVWAGNTPLADAPLSYPAAQDLAQALEEEAGPELARYIAVHDGMGRDPDGALALMAALTTSIQPTAPLTALRAELWLRHPSLPTRVARARATRDLEATLTADEQNVDALLTRTQLAIEENRHQAAAALLDRVKAIQKNPGYRVALLRARVDLMRGLEAQADESAERALTLQPGLCEALGLRYDLARRRDATALADELVRALTPCPGGTTRRAEHARTRGNLKEATATYETLLKRDPGSVGIVQSLSALYIADRRYDDARRILENAREVWPRNAELLRRLADVHDFAGAPDQALATREAALRLAGGDLSLRRRVHRAKTGQEPLSELAVSGSEAIARYEARATADDAASALVLDFAAVQAFEDGSTIDRIHVIQKALSQEGVSDIGEVHLPAGAAVLTLRTLKKDGTVLEPEDIEGKDSISMPAVEVGDYVESEYLVAQASRGPAQPGFTASSFFYQLAGVPNAWSLYVVRAPRAMGLEVDAHNVRSLEPKLEGDTWIFRHQEQDVPPFIPEPNAPPAATEYLPFVQLGAGAKGNDSLVAVYADAFLPRGRLTHEVQAFAQKAVGELEGVQAVRALHAAVMQTLQGRDAGLPMSATASLAQERGSRLWLLKAALEATGFPTRIALVRTFHADPSKWLFPNEQLLPYVALRTEVGEGKFLWMDTSVRFGPFGALPEGAQGRDAWLFPEPGRPLEKVVTPKGEPVQGKTVALDLELTADGTLRGSGEERYTGFDAAQLSEYLEQLPPDQRNQALQSALARYYGGAEMQDLSLTLVKKVGEDLVVRYRFQVPKFARPDSGRLVVGPVTFPTQLGRRYVQLAQRTTPLFIDSTERTRTKVSLKLPPGHRLNDPIGELRLDKPFGTFVRRESQQNGVVLIEEDFTLPMMRLPPDQYGAFAQFAGQVDLLQTRDLLVERRD